MHTHSMRLTMAVAMLVVATTLMTPGRADAASSYRWTHDGNGQWTNDANWQHLSGPVNAGYPNGVGDVAIFENPFTANRTVTLNQYVTLSLLVIQETHNIVFFNPGEGGIIFRVPPGATYPALLETFDTGSHVVGVPVILAADLDVYVGPSTARLTFIAGITQDATTRHFRKLGPGTVYFFSLNPNTYTGTTQVVQGTLDLQHLGGARAINGPLLIGGNTSASTTATVRLRGDNQILDTATVLVLRDGSFIVDQYDETISALQLYEGYASIGSLSSPGNLSVATVLLSGAGIETMSANSTLLLRGDVIADSTTPTSPSGLTGVGRVLLNGATRTFNVGNGPADVDLVIDVAIVGLSGEGLTKVGEGVARFVAGGVNNYPGSTNVTGGRLELARTPGGRSIPTSLVVGSVSLSTVVEVRDLTSGNFAPSSFINVAQNGLLTMTDAVESIASLTVGTSAAARLGGTTGSRLTLNNLSVFGSPLDISPSSTVTLAQGLIAQSRPSQPATIAGGGRLQLTGATHQFNVQDGQHAIDLLITTVIAGDTNARVTKIGGGVARFDGANTYGGLTQILEGTLLINGTQPQSAVQMAGGTLGGTGHVGTIAPGLPAAPAIAPGMSPGILTSQSFTGLVGVRLLTEIAGTTPGSGYDQLKVLGPVALASTRLEVTAPAGFVPLAFARFVIIDNDGTDPIGGTFDGLAEGATVRVGDHDLTLSYAGGDGNDVVLSSTTAPSYFLAEGATGAFFDDDVLIANPNTSEAPVTLTFLQEGGGTVVEHRTLPAQSRLTVHVDRIAGLENASPSVQVTSDNVLPLVVERTMFWDERYYGGHTANAVTQPELTWIFAEGFQGFFDTYVLIANANADATTATITFLRENDTPVVKTVPVAAFSRRTVYAGDYSELAGRAFGIVVSATHPVIAERAMYFGSIPGKLWTGGHANTGIAAASMSWFHAEGATGGFFNTFILLSNPQDTAARVELRFLLDSVAGGGEVITREKTIGAKQRLTVNPATEGDARLENAAVSTVVSSDVPIVSERSMYWPGDALPFGEGHNSAGVVSTGTRWGLAEGRVGGPYQFATFILLANPQSTAAQVTITYMREGGAAPIAKTYTVPATSRFNVDVGSGVPELHDEAFAARIEVTNGVPIAVERSLYWNANGVFWAGGTNALATPLP